MLYDYFKSYPTSLILNESKKILDIELSAVAIKFLELFEDRLEPPSHFILNYLIENISLFKDTPRLRHWLYVTKCMLRSKLQGDDPEPGSVQHLKIDSFAPNRVLNLHIIECLANFFDSKSDLPNFELNLSSMDLAHLSSGKMGKLVFRKLPKELIFCIKNNEYFVQIDNQIFRDHLNMSSIKIESSLFTSSIEIPIYDDSLCDVTKCNAPIVREISAVSHWSKSSFQRALIILREIDTSLFEECTTLSTAVLPLHSGGISYGSASAQDILGLIFLPGIDEIYDLAECYLHESLHQKLFRMDSCKPIFLDPNAYSKDEFYSPWRNDPRPLNGILHGCYVFVGVSLFWWHLFDSKNLSYEACIFQYYFRLQQVHEGLKVLMNHRNQLSILGTRILYDILECVTNLPETSGLENKIKMEVKRRIDFHSSEKNYRR
jgi:hypothetical protein